MLAREGELPAIRSSRVGKSKKTNSAPVGKYIFDSLKRIESGCYKDGRLAIDGGIGDYRISIFRVKDRNKRARDIPSLFSENYFESVERISPGAMNSIQCIVKSPNEKYLRMIEEEERERLEKEKKNEFRKQVWENENEEHLYYQYVPKYQKEKWFSAMLEKEEPKRAESVAVEPARRPLKKLVRRKEPSTHIFRFLDKDNLIITHSP